MYIAKQKTQIARTVCQLFMNRNIVINRIRAICVRASCLRYARDIIFIWFYGKRNVGNMRPPRVENTKKKKMTSSGDIVLYFIQDDRVKMQRVKKKKKNVG